MISLICLFPHFFSRSGSDSTRLCEYCTISEKRKANELMLIWNRTELSTDLFKARALDYQVIIEGSRAESLR